MICIKLFLLSQKMKKPNFFLFCILILFLFKVNAYTSVKPVWLTSSYMRAGNQNVIKKLTGQAIDPIYTFTFSSALPGIPNLAYGIKNYRGADYMGVQQFEIRRLNLTTTTFTVQVDIIGTTNLYILNVPYIAIDPTFPHHLNSFDNVPISYGSTLVNITTKQPGLYSYTNLIDYKHQANGRRYNQFGMPLQGNKMLLYICSMYIWATFRTQTKMYPIDLSIRYDIESQTTYRLSANLSTDVMITQLHFSQIIYNADDVQSSKKYVIVFQLWKTTVEGGFLPIPKQFVDNFIMGVTDFSTIDGKCGFQYQWNFTEKDNQFGVQILKSIQVSGACGFQKMTSTVFYMKTWQCPQSNPYFNLTTNDCQDLCGLYYFQNTKIFQCQSCQFACARCINSTFCTQCDQLNDHRALATVKGKKRCICMPGYFQDPTNLKNKICLKCIKNCLTCKNSKTCEICNEVQGYALQEDKSCIFCGFGCSSCKSQINLCNQCKQNFVYSSQQNKCLCPDATFIDKIKINCLSCNKKCLTCQGPSQYQCLSCPVNQNRVTLKQPNGLVKCVCNPFNYIQSQNGDPVCVKKSQQACDYGFIYMKEQKKCVEICGDGKIFGTFQCDDGNQIDGDGCSKTCQVQQGFKCQREDQVQSCLFVGLVNIVSAKAYKNPFGNYLLIQCQLDPIKKFFYTLNWRQGLKLIGPKMSVIDAWMQKTSLTINSSYFQDLSGKSLTIKYSSKSAKAVKGVKRNLFQSVFDFDITLRDYELPIQPANNLKPIYLQETVYENVKVIQKSSFIVSIVTIIFVALTFLLKSSFALLQVIFSLQLLFLSLASIKNINPLLSGLTQFSVIKGLRSTQIYFEGLQSPNQNLNYNVQFLGFVSSFFGNMNVILFVEVATIIATSALFLMSKKDLTMQFPFQFAKRQLMLVIFYGSMSLVFSMCLISTFYIFEVTLAILSASILICQVIYFVNNLKAYFHIDNTLDLSKRETKIFIGALLLIRLSQSATISLFNENSFISILIILSLQGFLSIILVVIRPYKRFIHNILIIVSQIAVMGFLVISFLGNMGMFGSQQLQNNMCIFQISINYLVGLLLILCFFYTFYLDYFSKRIAVQKIKLEDDSPRKEKLKDKNELYNSKFGLNIKNIEVVNLQDSLATTNQTLFYIEGFRVKRNKK